MILRFISKRIVTTNTLITIATGNGVADKLDGTLRQSRRIQHLAITIKHKATELRFQLITLYNIHQSNGMLTFRQSSSQRHHRVACAHKTHLEWFSLINLCHEVTTLRLSHHFQTRTREARIDLHTREGETRALGIIKTDTSNILDMLVGWTNNLTLDREGC